MSYVDPGFLYLCIQHKTTYDLPDSERALLQDLSLRQTDLLGDSRFGFCCRSQWKIRPVWPASTPTRLRPSTLEDNWDSWASDLISQQSWKKVQVMVRSVLRLEKLRMPLGSECQTFKCFKPVRFQIWVLDTNIWILMFSVAWLIPRKKCPESGPTNVGTKQQQYQYFPVWGYVLVGLNSGQEEPVL